jgi:hypothetical protein
MTKNIPPHSPRWWSRYFALHGCLICGPTRKAHAGNGLCSLCRRASQRKLKAILSDILTGVLPIQQRKGVARGR